MTASLPTILVLVLDSGQQPLEACLSSLAAQTYPRDRFQIEVVAAAPHTRAAACNAAIGRTEHDFAALIGCDTRADSQWLAEMVAAADRHRASAVAAKILDCSGEPVDLAGGDVSFTGHPLGIGLDIPCTSAQGGDRILFASSGSALLSRAAFLEAGGFDEDFSGPLEDVDLGWRLNTLGHTVVFAPDAVAYRLRHPAAMGWARARQQRLIERNALAMICKNYEPATFARVFPVAVALSLMRGLAQSGIDTLALNMSSRPAATVDVAPKLFAHLIALEDFCRQLPTLRGKCALVQERRRRSDAQLRSLFAAPLRLHDIEGPYVDVAKALIADLGVDELFGAPPGVHPVPGKGAPGPNGALFDSTRSVPPLVPKVSIVILTALGATHVCECLDSLRRQTYPLDRIEVIVVDNNSTEDPTSQVHRAFPGARVVRNPSNLGFAAANNIGAGVATGDYLVFLNDDTRVREDWLSEMVDTARRRGAAAVASCILDWSGQRIDFVDGAVSFQGKGFQLHYDAPAGSLTLEEKPLLFACGCAMLIDRAVFLDSGQWDEGSFAYYEDVELGWRLNLLGHPVWFAPRAVVYHKHHGTSGTWPEPPRTRLLERNSLRMIYELLEVESLQGALPASLLLAADRALLSTTLSRATDVPPPAALNRPSRRTLSGLILSTKIALVARGVNRRTPVAEAIRRLRMRGTLGVVRDVLAPRRVTHTPPRRAAYLAECGDPTTSAQQDPSESVSIDTAAILSGIYGFLSDLPVLTKRRQRLQQRRHVTDREFVGQFGSHWRQQCAARFQREHDDVALALVSELGLDALGDSQRGVAKRGQPDSVRATL